VVRQTDNSKFTDSGYSGIKSGADVGGLDDENLDGSNRKCEDCQ
jgi:hypothetical protein